MGKFVWCENSGSGDRNVGISLLRIFMCLEVVALHWGSADGIFRWGWFNVISGPHVPVFMFLAMFFSARLIFEGGAVDVKKRLIRLVIPHVFWAVVYWVGWIIMKGGRSFTPLIIQLATGHAYGLDTAMWFQMVLIILTVAFVLLFRCVRNDKIAWLISVVLAVVSAGLVFSSVNYKLFVGSPYCIENSIGRLLSMVPYAVLGLIMGYNWGKIKRWFIGNRVCVMAIILLVMLKLMNAKFGIYRFEYGYLQISNVFEVILYFLIFYNLPMDRLPNWFIRGINYIAKYSMGIYCSHLFIKGLMKVILGMIYMPWLDKTMEGSIVIFIVSLIWCVCIAKLPWKWASKTVS